MFTFSEENSPAASLRFGAPFASGLAGFSLVCCESAFDARACLVAVSFRDVAGFRAAVFLAAVFLAVFLAAVLAAVFGLDLVLGDALPGGFRTVFFVTFFTAMQGC